MQSSKMNTRLLLTWRQIHRSLSSVPKKKLADKFNFDLDEKLSEAIKTGSIKPRRHPGTQKTGTISLPEELVNATSRVIADFPRKSLLSDATRLSNYIISRHPPLEGNEYTAKLKAVQAAVSEDITDRLSPAFLEENNEKLLDAHTSKVLRKMKKEVYNWKPINFNEYQSVVYAVARMAPDFAALVKTLAEIKKRDENFSPVTMLDFGSGVGTGMWAMDSIWPGACKEVVCIDASPHMNTLADRLLRGGSIEDDPRIRKGGTFFKQYLPMSDVLKYDLVIVSRSLFELPNMALRLRTLDVLWRKTCGYLVVIEAGTNAGYKLVLEARDYILELAKNKEESNYLNGHVFAPCPHDMFCPKYFDRRYIPCGFEVSYKPYTFLKEPKPERDRYSYMVMKKGQSNEEKYPRMVQEPKLRSRHIVCEVCTKYGKLMQLTATKGKHSKECYKIVKYTKMGDLLPIVLPEPKQDTVTLDNPCSGPDVIPVSDEEYNEISR